MPVFVPAAAAVTDVQDGEVALLNQVFVVRAADGAQVPHDILVQQCLLTPARQEPEHESTDTGRRWTAYPRGGDLVQAGAPARRAEFQLRFDLRQRTHVYVSSQHRNQR